jgi:GNAT superfamily N-acetyltransferase
MRRLDQNTGDPGEQADPGYRRELGGGLVLRWSSAADAAGIARVLGLVWRNGQDDPPNPRVMDAALRHMNGNFPPMGPGDVALVEDPRAPDRPIVACAGLWRETWEYDGIPLEVGRPEDVATDPAYRNRGLVRAMFELLHARCAAEGRLVQAITGIPHFYRQFGYEYALDLHGRRVSYLALIPPASADEAEAYALREAGLADVPAIMASYERRRAASLVWNRVDESFWRYQIEKWADPTLAGLDATQYGLSERILAIVDQTGAVRGFAIAATKRWGRDLQVHAIEIDAATSWQQVMLPLLRALRQYGEQLLPVSPQVEPLREISFFLGRAHPAYDALGGELAPFYDPPYAWYVRVPDLPAFLRRITPALERRLAASPAANYTGTLKLDFYRGGLVLAFEQGRLIGAEPWQAPAFGPGADAGCPQLVFSQLLFGYRDLTELRYAFPDVWAEAPAEGVLRALFPKMPSWVLAL